MKMEVEEWRIERLTPYDNNPRDNDDAVPAVRASIERFGWRQPIVVDGEGVIIAGHTRYKAALEMGAGTVPVVVASDMTPEEVRAYRLADNKTHDLSEWSLPMLDAELAEIEGIDMSEFGFDLDVEALDLGMDDEHPGHGGTGMGMGSGDLRRVTCPKCGFEFFE